MENSLRHVTAILGDEQSCSVWEALLGRLKKKGISGDVVRAADFLRAAENKSSFGVLRITDSESVADYLMKCGKEPYVWLHEGNRNASFSGARYLFEDPGTLTADALERVYRRLAHLPWKILETKRCIVRETTEEDVDSFYVIYRDPGITEFMEDLYDDPEKERAYIRNYRETVYEFYEFGIWTVIEKESGEIIGRAGISMRDGCETPELGFVIGKTKQRQGFAAEVCRAILSYGKENFDFHKVQALVLPENAASLRLCEKLGFVRECEVCAENKMYVKMIWIDR